MPVTALPDLDHVYKKWEKKGPGYMTSPNSHGRNGGGRDNTQGRNDNAARDIRNGDAALMDGKRRWREKYGGNIQSVRHRRVRDRTRVVAVPAETVSMDFCSKV